MSKLLEVRDLHAAYGPTKVLHGISLDIESGGITTLLGANGAGKTTTLRALCQMMVATKGEITFAGMRIDGKSTEQIIRLGLGHVPDGRGTFLGLTTEENLRLGGYSRLGRNGSRGGNGSNGSNGSGSGEREQALDMERMYGYFPRLKERRLQQAGTLSGGEQQMLAIGRALMGRPRLLLLDEPSFGLAPLIVKDIFAIMRRINQEEQVSILLVEQNARLALDLADTAYLIETGRVVLAGPAAEIRKDDAVRRAYLGA